MQTRRIWHDKEGKVVLWQRPNIWLAIWFLAAISGLIVSHGRIMKAAYFIGSAALVIWALLEIFQGVNYFRRGLGVVVLAATVASLLGLHL